MRILGSSPDHNFFFRFFYFFLFFFFFFFLILTSSGFQPCSAFFFYLSFFVLNLKISLQKNRQNLLEKFSLMVRTADIWSIFFFFFCVCKARQRKSGSWLSVHSQIFLKEQEKKENWKGRNIIGRTNYLVLVKWPYSLFWTDGKELRCFAYAQLSWFT